MYDVMESTMCGCPARPFDPAYWMKISSYKHTEKIKSLTAAHSCVVDRANKEWVENANKNLSRLTPNNFLSGQFGQWAGESALMVGAGKSMRDNIEGIRRLQRNGWRIVVCDRAFITMRKAGIVPDFVVTLDSKGVVQDFLVGLSPEDKVACAIMQHPHTISKCEKKTKGNVFYYTHINPFSAIHRFLWAQQAIPRMLFALRAGYLVSFSAVDLAYWMGCSRIAMIGNDLCWHERTEVDSYYLNNPGSVYQVQKGRDAKFTIQAFFQAAEIFKEFTRLDPSLDLIDCSGGIIKGVRELKMEELS
jgi:hypothetical protein